MFMFQELKYKGNTTVSLKSVREQEVGQHVAKEELTGYPAPENGEDSRNRRRGLCGSQCVAPVLSSFIDQQRLEKMMKQQAQGQFKRWFIRDYRERPTI